VTREVAIAMFVSRQALLSALLLTHNLQAT
jgi:hypothetical protein